MKRDVVSSSGKKKKKTADKQESRTEGFCATKTRAFSDRTMIGTEYLKIRKRKDKNKTRDVMYQQA